MLRFCEFAISIDRVFADFAFSDFAILTFCDLRFFDFDRARRSRRHTPSEEKCSIRQIFRRRICPHWLSPRFTPAHTERLRPHTLRVPAPSLNAQDVPGSVRRRKITGSYPHLRFDSSSESWNRFRVYEAAALCVRVSTRSAVAIQSTRPVGGLAYPTS